MSPMTLSGLYPQTTQISVFFVAFHIFIMCERKDFKFGTQLDHG